MKRQPATIADSELKKSFSEEKSSATTTIKTNEMEQVLRDLENPPEGTVGLGELLREIDREYRT